MSGSNLTVVGVGIQASAHASPLTRAHVVGADKVLFLTTDVAASAWLVAQNASAESLERFYAAGKPRSATYEEMIEYVMSFVRTGVSVCVAVYGHPGVFTYPTHEVIRRARAEGYDARMIPAISAEDCLFADLGIDPADDGCQSYEATDFLVHDRVIDVTSSLVLWQIGVVGNVRCGTGTNERALAVLVDVLIERYGPTHPAVLYLASPHPIVAPYIRRLTLDELRSAEVVPMSTLFVPPLRAPKVNYDMLRRLGLEREFASAAS